MKKRYFLISSFAHLLPVALLLFVVADNKTSNDKEVNALMVSITGQPGLDIGNGSGIKNFGPRSKPTKAYGISQSGVTEDRSNSGLAGQGGGTGINAQTSYAGELIRKINEYKYYPPQARSLKMLGSVEVAFSVDSNGVLKDKLEIINSSGYELLDKTALKIIKNSAPFPAFPDSIKEKELNLKVSIDFTL